MWTSRFATAATIVHDDLETPDRGFAVNEIKPEGQQASQEDIDYADGLLKQGTPPADVRDQLMARGLSEDAAGMVVYHRIQGTRAMAVGLLQARLPIEAVVRALQDQGFSEPAAVALIKGLADGGIHAGQQGHGPLGLLVMGLGGLVFIIGLGLFIGNITRLFPTVPLAGFITMMVGGFIYRWGSRQGSQ
jgi:hypothetical protein